MLTWHDCITQLLRVRLIWCSLPCGLGLAQLCYGPLSWEHSLCWLLPEHTCSNNKMKLWWKSFFLQKCKVQVNTSSWHSQLCGLLLWHSAKVLTGFIKSFISKLANCSKKVKWLWEFDLTESFKYLWGKFPWQAPIIHLPIPSAAWCPVSRPVSTQRHIHTHPLLTSGTQSQSPVQAFGTLWLQYYILKFTISE